MAAAVDMGKSTASDSSATTTPSSHRAPNKRLHSKQTPISDSKKTPSTSTPNPKTMKGDDPVPTPLKKLDFGSQAHACSVFKLPENMLTTPHYKFMLLYIIIYTPSKDTNRPM